MDFYEQLDDTQKAFAQRRKKQLQQLKEEGKKHAEKMESLHNQAKQNEKDFYAMFECVKKIHAEKCEQKVLFVQSQCELMIKSTTESEQKILNILEDTLARIAQKIDVSIEVKINAK